MRYLVAATLVRGSDAGATTGLVLLAVAQLSHGARTGGLLAACLTAPHLLGPLVARRLDAARDGRRVLAAAFAIYGAALAGATLALGHAPLALAAIAVAIAGVCGPLLTGGLSSRLAGVIAASTGPTDASRRGEAGASRRAEGWDAVSYGIAGTAGPAAVAALAALSTPRVALLVLAASAGAAAAVTLTLPGARDLDNSREGALPVRAALRLMVGAGPLRRVGSATMLTALSLGGLPVVAVVFGESLTSAPGAGAMLVAAFGIGNLAGSLLVTVFPLAGEPERLVSRHVALMAVAAALCAVAPSYPLALAAFALVGAGNAPFFTATLAARSRYSPDRARAQVFVSLAGVKVAMASAGTALAGLAAGLGARTVLAGAAAAIAAGAAVTVVDRRISCPRTA
jgi:hypothetical protein